MEYKLGLQLYELTVMSNEVQSYTPKPNSPISNLAFANGLRKLIRKARRFSHPALVGKDGKIKRLKKFGTRLKPEELEERIAP